MAGITLQGLGQGTQSGYFAGWGLGLDGSQLDLATELRRISFELRVSPRLTIMTRISTL